MLLLNMMMVAISVSKNWMKALNFMAKTQAPLTPALALGDYWGGGDPQKWIKGQLYSRHVSSINLLKERVKETTKMVKFDSQAILDALAKGHKSVNDDMVIFSTPTTTARLTTYSDGMNQLTIHLYTLLVIGNAGYMPTKMLFDNLTNFAGYGVEDPLPTGFSLGHTTQILNPILLLQVLNGQATGIVLSVLI